MHTIQPILKSMIHPLLKTMCLHVYSGPWEAIFSWSGGKSLNDVQA